MMNCQMPCRASTVAMMTMVRMDEGLLLMLTHRLLALGSTATSDLPPRMQRDSPSYTEKVTPRNTSGSSRSYRNQTFFISTAT